MLMDPPRAFYIYVVLAVFLLGGRDAFTFTAQDIQGIESDDLVGGAGTLNEQPVRRQHKTRKEKPAASANSQPAQAREQATGNRTSREAERPHRETARARPVKKKTVNRPARETARVRETTARATPST